jgi:hypothetical protein
LRTPFSDGLLAVTWRVSTELKTAVTLELPELSDFNEADATIGGCFSPNETITVIPAKRPVYCFLILKDGDQPETVYRRFRPDSSIGEVKTIVCPDVHSASVEVSFQPQHPDDLATLDEVVRTDYGSQIQMKVLPEVVCCEVFDSARWRKQLKIPRSQLSCATPSERLKRLRNRKYELRIDGDPIADFPPDPVLWIKGVYSEGKYEVEKERRPSGRWMETAKTIGEFLADEDDVKDSWAVVDGVPCDMNDRIGKHQTGRRFRFSTSRRS